MNLFEDHGKIPIATMILVTDAARLNVTDPGLRRTRRSKHLYKCITKSMTSKVRDNLDPYIKSIKQDGPLFFKYLMLEVASNPSSQAEARDIRQTLSRVNLVKQMKSNHNNVKSFNLHVHSQLMILALYTIVQKEDLDADLMAAYRSIPCTAFRAKMRLLDCERRANNNWNPQKILAEAILNPFGTSKSHLIALVGVMARSKFCITSGHLRFSTPISSYTTCPTRTVPLKSASLLIRNKTWMPGTDTLLAAQSMFSKILCRPQEERYPNGISHIRLGIYLGQSPIHSSNVVLVLNPMTGQFLAQFHVVFDDNFSTIDDICLPGQMTKPSKWKELCTSSINSIIDEEQCIDNLWLTFDPKELFEDYDDGPAIRETGHKHR
jgi:hypothetical protein